MTDCAGGIPRLLRLSDIPEAAQLSEQAGWNQTADDWRMLLELAPEDCLAVEVDGELAATTTLMCYGQRLAWIGMVLTKMKFRGRGLARHLLTQALAQADQRGIGTVKLDATDQGKPIYEKLGFRAEQAVERWSRPGSTHEPETRIDAHSSDQWRESDPMVFGADRSQLLDRLAKRNPPSSVPGSYVFKRPGRQTAYLGPCVCDTPEAARTLMKNNLVGPDCGWSWDLLPNNASAVALAREFGFTPRRHLLRMSRGKSLQGKEGSVYAIAGFELG
jgi:predicted GNAT family N-acyltransferase